MDKGEEFEQVQRREAGEAEPAGGRSGVADIGGQGGGGHALAYRVVGKPGENAVFVQPDRMARRHRERRCARQRHCRGRLA